MARNSILYTFLLVWIVGATYVLADTDTEIEQGQTPVGATRVYPKTSFSCKNRPAGYYADMETGCQIYHMCDGLGREFSYSCPNTTLFQQRMLICDHWYMVNCSKAGADYSANLLIGQKDKPFVPEDEHQQRTPRPDLLDRPYAPDYSGESFRNQYKDLPPIQNHISDTFSKKEFSKPQPTRWSLKNSLKTKENKIFPNNRRNDIVEDNDLGTSHSTRYNTSGDISNEHTDAQKTTDSNTIVEPKRPIKMVKTPSRTYEPPFLYPIYNENYTTEGGLTKPLTTATVPITTTTTTTTTIKTTTRLTSTTTEATSTPTISTELPEIIETTATAFTGQKFDSTTANSIRRTTVADEAQRPTTLQQFLTRPTQKIVTIPPTVKTTIGLNLLPPFQVPVEKKTPLGLPAEPPVPKVPLPSRDLLPPFNEYAVHDVATTQGPPIYYEWKIPSESLEPPKLPANDLQKQSEARPTTTTTTTIATPLDRFGSNPFLSSLLRTKNSPADDRVAKSNGNSQTKRLAISDGNGNEILVKPSIEIPTDAKIEELQRELLIPDFIFPLEQDIRRSYEHNESLDSFQLKIKRSADRQKRQAAREVRQKRQKRRACPGCSRQL